MDRDAPLEETRPTGAGRARGLVSDRSADQHIQSSLFAPPPALADLVDRFWTARWVLPADATHDIELLGDPCVHIVFEAGRSRIVGVWTMLWRRRLEGHGLIRAAKLRPGCAARVLPNPVGTYTDQITPLRTVFPTLPAHLETDILDAPSHEDGLRHLTRWLNHVAAPPDDRIDRAAELVQRARDDRTLTRVDDLAAVSDVSVRMLQRLFRDCVGAPPKWVLRRFRLQEAAVQVEAGNAPCLTTLALDLGYADQAHLARDFKTATGQTLRGFQAAAGAS